MRYDDPTMHDSPPPPGPTNPYAAPETPADKASVVETAAHDLTRDEVRAFVGRESSYYWRSWQRAAAGSLRAGFSWPGFFLSFAWMFYRKMYREALIGFGILFGLGIVEGLVESATGTNLNALSRAENVVIAVTIGMLGNGLYLRRARRVIADARAQEPDSERREALLRARGGISWLGLVIAFALLVGWSAAWSVLATMAPG